MCELSPADGFVEINENLGDMIKYIANEPSVGLYYIQQHAHNAVPNVVRLKNNVQEKSQEVSLQTEDLEDSIAMAKSMKECGFPIFDEMIREIKTSLTIMSAKEPTRGVIGQRRSSYQIGGPSSWGSVAWARSAVSVQDDGERGGGYFTSMFRKAGSLKWSQLDAKQERETMGGVRDSSMSSQGDDDTYDQQDEAEELPVSSQVEDEVAGDGDVSSDGKSQLVLPFPGDYDEFKADREAKLEEWLKDSGSGLEKGTADAKVNHKLDSL